MKVSVQKFVPLLGFSVLAAIVFNGARLARSNDPQPAQARSQGVEVVDRPIAMQTPVQVRLDRTVAVASVQEVDVVDPENSFVEPIEANGGKLVVVELAIQNTGKASGGLNVDWFRIQDSQGRSYDPVGDRVAMALWRKQQGLMSTSEQLFPGQSVRTAFVFRVAPDASQLILDANGTLFDID